MLNGIQFTARRPLRFFTSALFVPFDQCCGSKITKERKKENNHKKKIIKKRREIKGGEIIE